MPFLSGRRMNGRRLSLSATCYGTTPGRCSAPTGRFRAPCDRRLLHALSLPILAAASESASLARYLMRGRNSAVLRGDCPPIQRSATRRSCGGGHPCGHCVSVNRSTRISWGMKVSPSDEAFDRQSTRVPLTLSSWRHASHRHVRFALHSIKDLGIESARDGSLPPGTLGVRVRAADPGREASARNSGGGLLCRQSVRPLGVDRAQ